MGVGSEVGRDGWEGLARWGMDQKTQSFGALGWLSGWGAGVAQWVKCVS